MILETRGFAFSGGPTYREHRLHLWGDYQTLIDFEQTAEAYVICTEGREASSKTGAYVYGCITWSHELQRTGSNWLWNSTGFNARRTIEGQSAFSNASNLSSKSVSDVPGHEPSPTMRQQLQEYFG